MVSFSLGFSWEVSCLCLCIVSLWMPGGTFDPNRDWSKQNTIQGNCSNTIATNVGPLSSSVPLSEPYVNSTHEPTPEPQFDVSTACNYISDVADDIPKSKASIIMLLMGIVGARFGEYMCFDTCLVFSFVFVMCDIHRSFTQIKL